MQTEVGKANGKKRGKAAKGRTEPDKQEAVVDVTAIRDRVDGLVKLCHAADEASTDFADAVKAAAEVSGLNASAVRSFIVAKAGENFEKKKKNVEQLSLLFEEVGG